LFQQNYKSISFQSVWISHALLVLLTISLFSSALNWIFSQLSQPQHYFSQISLAILIGLFIYQISTSNYQPKLCIQFNHRAMAGLIGAGVMFLLNEFYTAINIFSATFSIFGLYALVGFFIDERSWQRGLIFIIVLVLLLPFGDYFDVFFGFPLRLISAESASHLLIALGYSPQNLSTLIELDNRLTAVDLSCSGIHGLWSGMVFFVLLTLIEKKPINLAWVSVCIIFLALLTAINILRITIMVILEIVFEQSQFADLIHNSLGILGFAIACILGWLLLLGLKTPAASPKLPEKKAIDNQTILFSWLLVVLLIGFNWIYSPTVKQSVIPENNPEFIKSDVKIWSQKIPSNWQIKKINLNAQEVDFFPRQGAYAQKFQFNRNKQGGKKGSLVFVNTYYWKAHHDPRNCFQAQGFTVLNDSNIQIPSNKSNQMGEVQMTKFLVRKLLLTKANQKFRAYYWFQSKDQQTADYSQRLFSGLMEQLGWQKKQTWTMVSLLLEDNFETSLSDENQLLKELSQIVNLWIAANSVHSKSAQTIINQNNERK